VGSLVGDTVGLLEGIIDGDEEGLDDDELLGELLNITEGCTVGLKEGIIDIVGDTVGVIVGSAEGMIDIVGDSEGEAVGDSQRINSSHLFSPALKTPLHSASALLLSHALSLSPSGKKVASGLI
jgi:hypothetical protein